MQGIFAHMHKLGHHFVTTFRLLYCKATLYATDPQPNRIVNDPTRWSEMIRDGASEKSRQYLCRLGCQLQFVHLRLTSRPEAPGGRGGQMEWFGRVSGSDFINKTFADGRTRFDVFWSKCDDGEGKRGVDFHIIKVDRFFDTTMFRRTVARFLLQRNLDPE